MKIRLADYITQTLVAHGVHDVFLVTGGGAMHLNDAFGRCPGMRYICCHHEQACAMAAESYARLSGRMAAVNVTTGPGGINALNGVFGAWTDSIPMIVISGQVKWETTVRAAPPGLRQLGDQEADIIRMVEGITKYSRMIEDPLDVRYELEKALFLATFERPGPVWLDVPMNVQGALIDPEELRAFDPTAIIEGSKVLHGERLDAVCVEIAEKMRYAERPVILAGSGVRLAGAQTELLDFARQAGVPIVTAWNAHDLVPNSHPCYAGRPGTIGDRSGNFAVQNADFLLSLGCRLNIRQISYDWSNFAPKAFQVIVDIDETELRKPTLNPDLTLCADAGDTVRALASHSFNSGAHQDWLNWCLERRRRYPTVLPEYEESAAVNPYIFVRELFDRLGEDEITVTGDGTACVVSFQAASLKRGQRLYTNSGSASMGYDLPAAVGAWFGALANGDEPERIICLAGDGSVQMNLQELQTLATHNVPVKLFVLNNRGYHSIRQTQSNYFADNIVGCGEGSGLEFPSCEKLAAVYGFGFTAIRSHAELAIGLDRALNGPGLQMCEVMLDLEQQFAPKLASRKLEDGRMVSSPLDDMAPFLSREELAGNRIEN